MQKTGQHLVCSGIITQEFYDLPKKLWPCHSPGEYGGFKATDIKTSNTGEVTGLAYYDRFLLNEKNYNKMIVQLKGVRNAYRNFYDQQPPGAKLIWEELPEFKEFKKKYGAFWREIVIEVRQGTPEKYRMTLLFNIGKIGSSADRKKLCSFIDLALNIYDIDTFPGVRITEYQKNLKQHVLKQVRAGKTPAKIWNNLPDNLYTTRKSKDNPNRESSPISHSTICRIIASSK